MNAELKGQMLLSLHNVQLQSGWLRKWAVVIYNLQLTQPQTCLHTTSLTLQSPYSLLSKPNIYDTNQLLQHKFKERFYNVSLIPAQTENGSAGIRTQDGEFKLTVPDEGVSPN